MKRFLLSITCCLLGGCGAYGEPLLLARIYDNNDPCQRQNIRGSTPQERAANMPVFCGASGNRQYIYSTPQNQAVGAPVGYVKTK